MTDKERLKITAKETKIVFVLYALFFVWWYVTAYCTESDPSKYKYVCGFPAWFFYSCIVGYIGISFILWIVVRRFFTETPFDDEKDEKKEKTK